MFLGFVLGIFLSVTVYGVIYYPDPVTVTGSDIKIEFQDASRRVARGQIMVKIDREWYQFQKSAHMRPAE